LNDDLDNLGITASRRAGPDNHDVDRSIEVITRSIDAIAPTVPAVVKGDTCACHAKEYVEGWRKGRLQLLLHALVAIEATTSPGASEQVLVGDLSQGVADAVDSARRALLAEGIYPRAGWSSVLNSDPDSLGVTLIVAKTTSATGPCQWEFSVQQERARLRVLPEDVAAPRRGLIGAKRDALNAWGQVWAAVLAYRTGAGLAATMDEGLRLTSLEWCDEWARRTEPTPWSSNANLTLFPRSIASAVRLTDHLNALAIRATAGDDPNGAFPPRWYDTLRPTVQDAIKAIRRDLQALTDVNARWDAIFTQWEQVAGLGLAAENQVT
jgi:hypothetical protein